MPTFEIGLKRIEYGHTIIKARDEKEAKQKVDQNQLGKPIFYPGNDIIKLDIKKQNQNEIIN